MKNKRRKMVRNIIFLILLLAMGIYFIIKSFNYERQKIVNYKEQSNIDYKVYLKENDFYENDYLEKDMLYIASLIDNIKIDFNYSFLVDERKNIDFIYNITSKLVVEDETSGNIYFSKDYEIIPKKELKMINKDNFVISENVTIDYPYFNDLANKFKMSYGINPVANLIIYFSINKSNHDVIVNNNSTMSIIIPLSEKAVNIKMDYKDINEESKIISDNKISLGDISVLCLGIILVIISIVVMIKMLRLINVSKYKNSKYDKQVKKILREYDRLIVEINTKPIFDNSKVVDIPNFSELLDVRDNLKLPIMYYVLEEHRECYFYIKHDNTVYLYKIWVGNNEKNL